MLILQAKKGKSAIIEWLKRKRKRHIPVISAPVLVSPGKGVATQEGGGAISTGGDLVAQEEVGVEVSQAENPSRKKCISD